MTIKIEGQQKILNINKITAKNLRQILNAQLYEYEELADEIMENISSFLEEVYKVSKDKFFQLNKEELYIIYLETIKTVINRYTEVMRKFNIDKNKKSVAEGEADTDFLLGIYSNLLEHGWTIDAIEDMNIITYLEVLAYRNNLKQQAEEVPIEHLIF